MTLGPLMVGISTAELTSAESESLHHPLVGGVILFKRNFRSVQQIHELACAIHEVRKPRLVIAVDHEGGRVQRFVDGFTHLPAARKIGEIYDHDTRRARHIAESVGWLMASELRAVGIDLSFAPVVDLDWGSSTIIGDRAFHRDPEVVAQLARACMTGMQRAGMAAVAKHFPGHGYVREDTHVRTAVDQRPVEDILMSDLVPFERLVDYGVAAIMCSHVIYSSYDKFPASFSARWIREILRRRLGFQGVVFSDDIHMSGAGMFPQPADRVQAALNAGCDMVIIGQQPEAIPELLEGLDRAIDPVSAVRLARMHGRHATTMEHLHQDPEWVQAARLVAEFNPPQSLELL